MSHHAVLGAESLVPGITHDNLLLTLLQLALLLFLARGLGHAVARLGIPSVLGELLAGVLVGPSILGKVSPSAFEWLFPPEALQRNLLDMVAFIGVTLLLVLTGLEIDLPLIASKGRTALKVSLGGIIVPFALGMTTAWLLVPGDLLTDAPRLTFALFIGTALSISAIPVIAKVLIELRVIKRDIGQLTLAAGMVDDAIGWILLSVVAGLATSGSVDIGVALKAVVSVVAVVGLTLTVGRRVFGFVLRWVDVRLPGEQPKLTLLLIAAFGMAALTQALGIEAVLGTFLVGIVFGTLKRFDHRLVDVIESIALSVFAPIFFARAGIAVDLGALFTPRVFAVGMIVLAVAIAGKFIGAYAGSMWAGLSRFEGLSLGAGMNARGALEIIIATIGLNIGVLSTEMYTIIVMVAIVTSLMAPPILRYTVARVPLSPTERSRLEREERLRKSFLGNVRRVLVPTRGGANSQLAAQLLARMFHGEDVEVTAFYVADGSEGHDDAALDRAAGGPLERFEHHLRGVDGIELRRLVRAAGDPVAGVLSEAALGYDLVFLGATEMRSRDQSESVLFSRFVDAVVQGSSCPVLVVSTRAGEPTGTGADGLVAPIPLRRVLLPTLGEEANREAAEVAFAAARADDASVDAVHFLLPASIRAQMSVAVADDVRRVAEGVVAKEAALGRQAGVVVNPEVVPTELSIEEAILTYASEIDADLIVFRSDERHVTQRAFFSHQLDHILSQARCPVAIVSGTSRSGIRAR